MNWLDVVIAAGVLLLGGLFYGYLRSLDNE